MTQEIEKLGPAMRKLTERQRAFVVAAFEVGGSPQWYTEAARRAGYTGNPNVLRVTAHRLYHNPAIQKAMKEMALSAVSAEPLAALAVLADIAHGEIPASASERIKAANSILSRAGMPETTEHKIKVEHSIDNNEAIEKLYRFAKLLGRDPKELIGAMGMEIIDGEFREVSERRQIEKLPIDDFTFDPEDTDGD